MSSTRRSAGDYFHQERFCSSPEVIGDTINGLAAAKRIALISDQATRELLWFIQWRSLAPGGLRALCSELIRQFPERLTTPTLTKVRRVYPQPPSLKQLQQLEKEFPERWDYAGVEDLLFDSERHHNDESHEEVPDLKYYEKIIAAEVDELPAFFTRCCVDPTADISKGAWFFDDLPGALHELRRYAINRVRARLADTAISRKINETLNFFFAMRKMVLIEGVAGIGRTATSKAWCDAHPGLVRYVEVPSSSDDRSLYAAIARALGVACGASYKAQQIKVRVEEMLFSGGVALVLDESQYLWGQFIRPRRTPDRILWLKTLFDAGVPIALVAHIDFSKWQQHYVARTLWTDEQFERRLNRRVVLPTVHSKEDMLKIARSHMPRGEPRSWKLLAAYALGTEKKQASGIVEALASANYHAREEGRDRPDFRDIKAVLSDVHGFLQLASAESDLQSPCTTSAAPAKTVCKRPRDRGDSSFLTPIDRNGVRANTPIGI